MRPSRPHVRAAVPSLRVAGAGLAAAVGLGTAGFLATGALLAPAAAATSTATVTWSSDGFGSTPKLHVGDAVRWRNTTNFDLVVGDTTSNWSYQKTVAANSTSTAYTFTKAGSYGFRGTGGLLGTTSDSGTISVTAPKPSPTPSRTHTSSPKPDTSQPKSPKPDQSKPSGGGKHHGSNDRSPSPAPVGGIGSAGNPALGAGELLPPFRNGTGKQPTPLVAPGSTPSPVPTASVDAFGDPVPVEGVTLAQPVPARRFGLPGAVAAVLVAGVVVGVVRLAKAEYGVPPDPGAG
jgi:plastocyanin